MILVEEIVYDLNNFLQDYTFHDPKVVDERKEDNYGSTRRKSHLGVVFFSPSFFPLLVLEFVTFLPSLGVHTFSILSVRVFLPRIASIFTKNRQI